MKPGSLVRPRLGIGTTDYQDAVTLWYDMGGFKINAKFRAKRLGIVIARVIDPRWVETNGKDFESFGDQCMILCDGETGWNETRYFEEVKP